MSVCSQVSSPEVSPEFPLFVISNLIGTDIQITDWLWVYFCYCSSHRHHTDLVSHWTPCVCNWFACSCSSGNGQHNFCNTNVYDCNLYYI